METMQVEAGTASDLLTTLLDCAPGEPFVLRRTTGDGVVKEIPVRLQVLRVDENHAALIAAQLYAKKRGELKEYGDVYREGQAIEILVRALRKPERQDRPDGTHYYPAFFLDSEQLRRALTERELVQCLNAYEITKAKYGSFETLEPDELDLAILKLADGYSGAHFLARLDSSQWPELLIAVARRAAGLLLSAGLIPSDSLDTSESGPASSSTDTTSPSGPPSDTSSVTPSGSAESVPGAGVLSRSEALTKARKLLRGKVPPQD